MKVSEKLAELRNNVLRDVSDIISGSAVTLWDDATLLRYIKLAERKFARETFCIRDSTTASVTQVTLQTGVRTYALDASVIGVLSARYELDTFDLQRSGHSVLMSVAPPEYLFFDPSSQYTLSPGKPLAYYTDETLVFTSVGKVTISVYPDPSATEDGKKLYLRVVRMPLTDYSQPTADSDIPEDYELDPLQWAAHLATRNHDADADSPPAAAKHETNYRTAVSAARKEMIRKIFSEMKWSFGTGGFSWTR